MISVHATRRSTWIGSAILASVLAAPAAAQVNYSQDFSVDAAGWTISGGFSPGWSTDSACADGSLRSNIYGGSATCSFVSPLLGTTLGGNVDLAFDYKCVDYGTLATTPSPWGSLTVEFGSSASGPWTPAATITDETQTGSCLTKNVSLSPATGDLYIRFSGARSAGDFWLNIDNVVAVENTGGCSGTPAPGDTLASSASVCSGAPVSLSLQNATPGTGVSYQWYSSTVSSAGPWTMVGGNTASYATSQTATTWYYCDVTCSSSTGSSTVVQVDLNAGTNPESFDSGSLTANCWSTQAIVGTSVPLLGTGSAFGVGTGSARFNFYSWSTPRETALVSPEFAALAGATDIFFDVAGCTYVGGEVDVIVLEESNDGGATWTTVVSMDNGPGGVLATRAPQGASFSVPAATDWASLAYTLSAGTNRVRFHAISDYGNDVHVDNISIGLMPSARHTNYGAGCGMSMTASPAPISGTTFNYDLPNVPLACPAPDPVFHFGFVIVSFEQNFAGTDLPSLGFDSPGCNLHVNSLDVLLSYVDVVPGQTVALSLPAGAPAGAVLYSQAVALLCPAAPNNAGLVLSNAVRSYINSY